MKAPLNHLTVRGNEIEETFSQRSANTIRLEFAPNRLLVQVMRR